MISYLALTSASLLFVGTHFLMSHPLRAPLVQRFGPNGFMLVYSAVSLVTFVWMVLEFGRAPKAQEMKKRAMLGGQWAAWIRRTQFIAHPAALLSVGAGPWIAGLLLWAVATWAHTVWGVVGAGLFRWIGV
ncbi:NnrU family protein [Sphingorhabdus sp.]|jgi:hypothetical protein|uniref:NnrU family protein n=1 Tax=Sphingorhabdus sp. TaxID=1902408 RepID=UPI0037C57209